MPKKLPESGVFPVKGLPESVDLGDVIVYVGSGVKYRYRTGASGDDRSRGLRAMLTGGEGFTYYYAPFGGPAIRMDGGDYKRIRNWDCYKVFGGHNG